MALLIAAPCTAQIPRSYEAPFAVDSIEIDGRLTESTWARAPRTEPFVDIRGPDHPEPSWATHAQIAWDDRYLYVAAALEEPHLWATLEERDASLVRIGSIFWMSLQPGEAPRTAECIAPAAAERYGKLFHALREEGLNIAPSAYEVGFLSTAHDETHVDALADAVARRLA